MLLMCVPSRSKAPLLPSADMAAETGVTRCAGRTSAPPHELLPESLARRVLRARMFGAIEAELVSRQRRIDECTVVWRRSRTHVRAEMLTGDTHAAERDEPLFLQRADHLHDAGEERSLLLGGQVRDGVRHELRPGTRAGSQRGPLLRGR